MSDSKVWFVTGASKGFGALLVEHLLDKGFRVAASSRRLAQLNGFSEKYEGQFFPVEMQVNNQAHVEKTIESIIAYFGRIDVVVNNAGYGLFGTIEELEMTEIKSMFDVNVFGVMHVSKGIMKHFRTNKSGVLLNIASVAGSYTAPSLGLYSATKAAVIQFTEALKLEVEEFNIRVCAICPGGFRTDFLDDSSMQTAQNPLDEYTLVRNTIDRYSSLNKMQGGDPNKFPEFVVKLVEKDVLPARIYVGSDALRMMDRRIGEIQNGIDENRDLSGSTDFDVA